LQPGQTPSRVEESTPPEARPDKVEEPKKKP